MATFPANLAARFGTFHDMDYSKAKKHYMHLAKSGQAPEVMVIACADSRVSPDTIFRAQPGEIFTVRNVANIVPPYETSGLYHGVSAALEFAVLSLKVKHIIVMGHSQCGGIHACLHHDPKEETKTTFVSNWMSLLNGARDKLIAAHKGRRPEILSGLLEREGIVTSLANLRTFPDIKQREEEGVLSLHGAHFDIAHGMLSILDEPTGKFAPLSLDRLQDNFKRA